MPRIMRVPALLLGTSVLCGVAADVTGAASEPLRVLVRRADAVVLVRIERTTRYDAEGFRLHRLRAQRVLSGRLRDRDPDVIEMRDNQGATSDLAVGRRAIVLLRPGPSPTDFGEDLPRVPCFELVAGRDGIIPVASDEELDIIERILRQAGAIAELDEAAARAARRKLAFAELASHIPRLVADALVELRGMRFAPLSSDEALTVAAALRAGGLDANLHEEVGRLAHGAGDAGQDASLAEPSMIPGGGE